MNRTRALPNSLRSTALVLASSLLGCAPSPSAAAAKDSPDQPPSPQREFRAAWVATVGNIDWPSKPGLPPAQQRAELAAILDKAVHLKLNAVILQVRPACDALYASRIEPWSEYLTGQMGKAPDPFYDPLAYAVEQAHAHGLELHAWFNPFRARHSSTKSMATATHVSKRHPEWTRTYGNLLWLDPAEKAARDHSIAVIMDVVRRYDIDGVHLDDYFYPYRIKDKAGKPIDFPDDPSWKRYQASGGKLSRADWRRKNVDDFVLDLYRHIKSEKRWVKFGLSPFGIWRPGHPPQIKGLDAYEELYADSRKWIANAWADYFAPQLYWATTAPAQSYPVLLAWWARHNLAHRHLWPGSRSEKVGSGWNKEEIVTQILLSRRQPGATGHVHWNVSALMRNKGGLADELAKAVYTEPALIPASPWLDNTPPAQPLVRFEGRIGDAFRLSWKSTGDEPAAWWVLQTKQGARWTTEILPGTQVSRSWNATGSLPLPALAAVAAVDRCGNMGPRRMLEVSPTPSGTEARKQP